MPQIPHAVDFLLNSYSILYGEKKKQEKEMKGEKCSPASEEGDYSTEGTCRRPGSVSN